MAALSTILDGLGASSVGNKLWDKYRKSSGSTPYDFVIHINSLKALGTSGWEIELGTRVTHAAADLLPSRNIRGVVVAVLGSFNRGKSFLINQHCGIELPHGNLIHTEGISITVGTQRAENIVFIDTAGTDTAILKDELDDKKATEALLREIALHLCSFIIIVVNRLRATDQSYIQQVIKHLQSSTGQKNIIIIHNLMDVETVQDVNELIREEIQTLCDAKLDKMNTQSNGKATEVQFFCSTNNGIQIRHFIFAKHGSDAAEIWNGRSIDGVMTILQGATDSRQSLDIIPEMIKFVNTKLPQLFVDNHDENIRTNGNDQQRFQVELHATKLFIVLSERKELEDLERDPCALNLSPKLLYDDAGYFIGISTMDKGQWQPLYNLYETDDKIVVFIELAGFKKGEARIEVLEEVIAIEGCRSDLKASLSGPIVRQEKIPIGSFRLEIPLGCRIDQQNLNMDRVEGLCKITCSKRTIAAVVLE